MSLSTPTVYSPAVARKYADLYSASVVDNSRAGEVIRAVTEVQAYKDRYAAVGGPLGIPWKFIGLVHLLECSCRFDEHLHNGDPLTARTVHVPAGRPIAGDPPFTWEESAIDALRFHGLYLVTDWSDASLLFQLEKWNGFGYALHHPNCPSPYLWAGTDQYTKGKYAEDGKFDPELVSKQIGAAAILRFLTPAEAA